MTITFVIMVEKICFHVLFGISLYQSPRVQVVLQSPLHFDSIISFSTKKPPCLIKLRIPFGYGKVASVVKQLFSVLIKHTRFSKSVGQKMFFLFIKTTPKNNRKRQNKKALKQTRSTPISSLTGPSEMKFRFLVAQHNYQSWWTLGSAFSKTIQSDEQVYATQREIYFEFPRSCKPKLLLQGRQTRTGGDRKGSWDNTLTTRDSVPQHANKSRAGVVTKIRVSPRIRDLQRGNKSDPRPR